MYIFPVLLVNVAVALVLSLAETPGTPARPVTGAAVSGPSGSPGAAATGQSIQQTHARLDELWKRRDDAAALAEQKVLLDQVLPRAGKDYGVLWRAARYYFWTSDDPDLNKEEKMRLGKIGWDLAERAVAINPNDVAGHFWAVGTMGNYSLGLGVMRALAQRIEGKFRDRVGRAEQLDPSYAHGGIPLAWGRYYAKLPWPKYDQKKARAYFAKALQINPHNLRARVFLAELLLEEDEPQEARRLLDEVMKASVGKYDAPEEKRSKALAARALRKLEKALN